MTKHTINLIEKKIRLPKEIVLRIDALGTLCGLTGDQMASAIMAQHLYDRGWIGFPKDEPKTDPTQKETPHE